MNLLESLRAAVGPRYLLTADEDTAPFLTDWRRRFVGRALAVALPADTAQASAVVACCAAAGVPVIPQGGNTGLVGGGTPDASASAVLISTRRMKRVRAIDADNDTITVEAGCTLLEVQQAAAQEGRLFPLSLAAEGSATIGGNLSTNAGGTQVLRYGNARELALGLEVVLPDGRVWNGLRGLRKDNTGYDLKQLFIGAEGTLGLICAATLRLYPMPKAQRTALAALPSLQAAVRLLRRLRADAGPALTAFEVMAGSCLQVVERAFPDRRRPFAQVPAWTALLELSDHESDAHAVATLERALGEALEAGEIQDAAVAQSEADSLAFWRLRESIPEAQSKLGGNVKNDISLPVSRIPAFVESTNARLAALHDWIEPVVFGHLGDGNLHYNMGARPGCDPRLPFDHEEEIHALVNEAVAAADGSISAEHGIGQLKREALARYKSAVELDAMRAIKRALDPNGRFNPGRIL